MNLIPEQPQVLLSWLNPPNYIAPVRFFENQVTAIREAPPSLRLPGFPEILSTPSGAYSLRSAVERQCSSPQNFDLVIVQCDSSGVNVPCELSHFDCPKVLLLCDTHHQKAPIRHLLEYAENERFDHIVGVYNRQHLHWFVKAGFKSVVWLPALTLTQHAYAWHTQRTSQLVFVGQSGKYHPRRHRLLQHLAKLEMPMRVMTGNRRLSSGLHAQSVISLNSSLNADLNLRVFEILGSGGFLLTDRLGSESGMEQLFTEGEQYVGYDSETDLAEKARHYLDHPKEALRIAEQGYLRFLQDHLPQTKIAAFQHWLMRGEIEERYLAISDRRSRQEPVSQENLLQRIMVYEAVQELHRVQEEVQILLHPTLWNNLAEDLSDLPRAHLHPFSDATTPPPDSEHGTAKFKAANPEAAWDLVIWPKSLVNAAPDWIQTATQLHLIGN